MPPQTQPPEPNLTSEEQVEAFALAYYEDEPDCTTLVQGLIHQLYQSQNERKQKLQGLVAQPFYLVRLIEYYYKFRLLPDNPALLLDFSVNAALECEVTEKHTMTPERGRSPENPALVSSF